MDTEARVVDAGRELYSVRPEDFVSTRSRLVARARESGDRSAAATIGKLRRPSTAAWVVNVLVRERPDVSARVGEVGAELRLAQSGVDAGRLRALRPERDALVEDVVRGAAEVAGVRDRRLTPAVLEEVRSSVIAALAGEEATAAFRSGTLTRALSYSGFGEVDLSDAVVRSRSGAVMTVLEGGRPSEATDTAEGRDTDGPHASGEHAAESEVAEVTRAEDTLARAEAELAEAGEAARRARDDAASATARVEDAERVLVDARDEERRAREEVTTSRRAVKEAERARASAARELARARASLDAAAGRDDPPRADR